MTASATSSIGFLALIVVFLLSMDVLAAHAAGSNPPPKADIVAEACNRATAMSSTKKVLFTKKFCQLALRSDDQSPHVKDYTDLVLVSMDRLKVRIDDTAAKIKAVAPNITATKERWAGRGLQFCSLDYSDMAGYIPVCHDMVKRNFGGGSFSCVERIHEAGRDCIEALDAVFLKEVLSDETDELMMLISLTNTMLQIRYPN